VVFVGLGFPKQERLIQRLQATLPSAWFMGCGAAIGFVAGVRRRAPGWMQRTGLEWLHRLLSEPHRLGRRYLLHDMPFAARLLTTSALGRTTSPTPAPQVGREDEPLPLEVGQE
jgi:N-acetylglucosaminyldiphosphoundecaprenol N-acetyl-beta-D-mannosaminyltransferase